MEEEFAAAGYKGRMAMRKILLPEAVCRQTFYLIVAMAAFLLLLLGKNYFFQIAELHFSFFLKENLRLFSAGIGEKLKCLG